VHDVKYESRKMKRQRMGACATEELLPR
jgi:hypothetical protein